MYFFAANPPPTNLPVPLCLSSPLPSTRPWDPLNDLIQFEKDGCIQTKVRHRTPMVRSGSLISLSNQGPRRDNCKCQVGRPDRKKPQQNKASRRLSHIHRSTRCTVFIVASSICVVIAVLIPLSSPLLLLCLYLCVSISLLWHLLLSLYGREGHVTMHQ